MALYPTEVAVNEAKIQRVIATYKKTYSKVLKEITTATDFGVANRKAILSQIKKELEKLGVDVQGFIEKEIPKAYKEGAEQAVQQLKNAKAPIEVATGFNKIHGAAVEALVDDTAKAFGETMSGVYRQSSRLLGKATKQIITQRIAEGTITGANLRRVKNEIKGELETKGLSALIDKSGREWSLDRYSEMLFRTKTVEARNRGLINRMAENGYDLVQVSNHNSSHRECAVWEGKVLSATGATAGYPTIADAENAGLFHPNCQHAINALIPSIARQTNAYDPETETLVIEQDIAKP